MGEKQSLGGARPPGPPVATALFRRLARNLQWEAVTGVWGRSPQRPKYLYLLGKIKLILGLF